MSHIYIEEKKTEFWRIFYPIYRTYVRTDNTYDYYTWAKDIYDMYDMGGEL